MNAMTPNLSVPDASVARERTAEPGTGAKLDEAPRLPLIAPTTPRAFSCRCGRPVFFQNSECLACHTPLGYAPEGRQLLPLESVEQPNGDGSAAAPLWRRAGASDQEPRYLRCANLESAAACNWLVAPDDLHAGQPALCRCCRLTRTLPDLSQPDNVLWWQRIETAKRRMVSSLLALGLPVQSKMSEDPEHGLVFDLLGQLPGGKPVVTGHDDGVVTLDVHEADDAHREQRRTELGEPYRTLLGHLRHEVGHYYWQRLVEHSEWLQPYRELFGDERQDYAEALKKHYADGAPADWDQRFVSAYASSHPWEDWAETWAHYMHLIDTLDTARSFGVDGERVELRFERYGLDVLGGSADGQIAHQFLQLFNSWMELTGVLNELSRSMGVADFYPFVLSAPAVRKLYLVHRIIAASGSAPAATAT